MLSDPEMPEETTRTLASVVREIEAHAAESGWDRAASLFALVPTISELILRPTLTGKS